VYFVVEMFDLKDSLKPYLSKPDTVFEIGHFDFYIHVGYQLFNSLAQIL